MKILIIEDDNILAEAINTSVLSYGIIGTSVSNGNHADQLLEQAKHDGQAFDAVILDLNLPGKDGVEVLTSVRARNDLTPILVLTARTALSDKVDCLQRGADDYLLKPFAVPELVARLRSICRRHNGSNRFHSQFGNLMFDSGRGSFFVDGALLILPAKPQALLEKLFSRRGNPVTKDYLTNIDGSENSVESIDILISRLRKKLRESEASVFIKTIYGIGYILSLDLG